MRYLRFAIFLSAILVAIGIFLPYVQLGIGGFSFGKKSSMTLYGAVNSYTFVERVAESSEAATAQRIADGLLARLDQGSGLGDSLRSLKGSLRDVKEVREQGTMGAVGTVLRVVGWVFLGILTLVCWLMLQTISRGRSTRRRAVGVAGLMGLVAIVSIALFFGVREALALANAEVGAPVLSLGSGAYVMLIGAIIAFVAASASIKFEGAPAPAAAPAAGPAAAGPQAENRSSLSSD